MIADALTLRPFDTADIAAAQALTRGFGWPHRIEDWELAARVGSGVVVTEREAVLGTAMAWPYGISHAALGLVAVAPAAQRRGIGRRLMQALLQELGDRTVMLHATDAAVPLYASLGFVAGGVVRQHQGLAPTVPPAARGDIRLRALKHGDALRVKALDRTATGLARDALLGAILAQADGVIVEAQAAGFALRRRFGRGDLIGPVVAADVVTAQAMIATLLAARPGEFVRLDVPEAAGLSAWLATLGLADVGPVLRMVRGRAPEVAPDHLRTFVLALQAFG